MASERLTLDGCSPTPLASYLKALGVLRLLSSGANNVSGEAVDPGVRGWWEGERFHLRTTLGRDGVLGFFLHEYAPQSGDCAVEWRKRVLHQGQPGRLRAHEFGLRR